MLIQLFYPYLRFSLGTLYPAYKTWKALKRKDETIRRRWMKYWVSYAAFQVFELVSDVTLAFILPFYIELKLASLIWLVLGTRLIFDTIVNRELARREKSIDKSLTKIVKARDEIVAILWHEVSRCSVKIITALMTGGISVLVKTPDQSGQTSPVEELEGDDDETIIEEEEQNQEEPMVVEDAVEVQDRRNRFRRREVITATVNV